LESLLASAAIWISSKHTAQAMSPGSEAAAPSGATDAVLKPSEPVPADAKEVQGIDFNQYANRSITVEELIAGYSTMGFQATAVGEAVRIINDMVSRFVPRLAVP
jgi:deoxyhypusine synthase